MSRQSPAFYDCANCPSYCCSYPEIEVDGGDLRRLAVHFGLGSETARRRFTKPGKSGTPVLRHIRDPLFGTVCRFLDRETRTCTVHEARPRVCRDHPGSPSCHYYAFLMAERRYQGKANFLARAYNVCGSPSPGGGR